MQALARLTLLFVSTLVFPGFGVSATNTTVSDASALMEGALKQEELFVKDVQNIDLRAKLEFAIGGGKVVTGDYALERVSHSQSREEIRFANFSRIIIRESNGYWQKRTVDYQPEAVFQLEDLLNFDKVLKLASGETIGKITNRNQAGTNLACVEVRRKEGPARGLCFDQNRDVLASVDYFSAPHQNPPEITRVEYSEFVAANGYLFPGQFKAFSSRKVIIAFTVSGFSTLSNVNPDWFAPPANAEFWPSCEEGRGAKLIKRVQPDYPANDRANHVRGTVVFFAVIEADGSLSHITSIRPAPAGLESNAGEAVRQWRYDPVTCAGTPHRAETRISVDFWLND
jgi:TonB family protein